MPVVTCAICGSDSCACGTCHACSGPTDFPMVVQAPPSSNKTMKDITKSQKVKGILALIQDAEHSPRTVAIRALITKATAPIELGKLRTYPLFARPCPITPCHGFVDSRVVNNEAELRQVWAETIAADPEGELILMQVLSAKANAIYTPSLVTVGDGHDGATAGKNTTLLPLVPKDQLMATTLKRAGLKEGDAPYVEVVMTPEEQIWLTQLRAGPPLTSVSPDYVPMGVTVEEIVSPNGEDLLAWAKRIESCPPGTIVYHPGGSPTDHYFVHARLSKVPVITSFEPKVGMALTPITDDIPPPHPLSVLRGVAIADKITLERDDLGEMVTLMLTAFHHNQVMGGAHGQWLGFAAGMMIRAGSLALRGEARHAKGRSHGGSRDKVYIRMLKRSLSFHRSGLNRLAILFQYSNWPSTGYGGPKWAACAASLVPLFNGVRRVVQDQDDASVTELIKALNVSVNQAHNGGWWLNKFISQDVFDYTQEGTLIFMLRAGFTAHRVQRWAAANEALIQRQLGKYAQWPETKLVFPSIKDVSMMTHPGVGGLVLSVSTRVLKNHKLWNMRIPLDSLTPIIGNAISNIKLVEMPDGGLKLIANIDANNAVLWEAPPIVPANKEKPSA